MAEGVIDADITGFRVEVITGLRADASGVGHNGEVTAEVKVNGATVGSRSDEGRERHERPRCIGEGR